jgi:hypothetical protein
MIDEKIEKEQLGSLSQTIAKKEDADPLITVRVEGYRWMVISLVLAFLLAICVAGWIGAERKRANNVKTVIVKIFPDGHSVVEPYEEGAPVDVWPSVLNADLTRWMVRRHREDPTRISSDYVYAAYFMSPIVYAQFLDKNEYNAFEKIRSLQNNKNLPLIIPKITGIRHVDAESIDVNNLTGEELIETQFFIDLERRSQKTGSFLNPNMPIQKVIVTISWRINPQKRERSSYATDEEHTDALFENPIGIEILDYEKNILTTGGDK